MDIETYMREARRFDNHKPEHMLDALAHGLMAEVGEVFEHYLSDLYGHAFFDELGDVEWNVVRLADEVGMPAAELLRYPWGPADNAREAIGELVRRASKVPGILEKWHRTTRPGWELKSEMAHCVWGVQQALTRCTGWYGYNMDAVRERNIRKLTARYAERGLPVKEAL